jgi:hypothetical protein
VLSRWLELSIEQLCDDALFHCITGDRSIAFNRDGFEQGLNKVPSVSVWQQQAELIQETKDQQAIATERVA